MKPCAWHWPPMLSVKWKETFTKAHIKLMELGPALVIVAGLKCQNYIARMVMFKRGEQRMFLSQRNACHIRSSLQCVQSSWSEVWNIEIGWSAGIKQYNICRSKVKISQHNNIYSFNNIVKYQKYNLNITKNYIHSFTRKNKFRIIG